MRNFLSYVIHCDQATTKSCHANLLSQFFWAYRPFWPHYLSIVVISGGLGMYPTLFCMLQGLVIDHAIHQQMRGTSMILLMIMGCFVLQLGCWRFLEWLTGRLQPKIFTAMWQKCQQHLLNQYPQRQKKANQHSSTSREKIWHIASNMSNLWPHIHFIRGCCMICFALGFIAHLQAALAFSLLPLMLLILGLTMLQMEQTKELNRQKQQHLEEFFAQSDDLVKHHSIFNRYALTQFLIAKTNKPCQAFQGSANLLNQKYCQHRLARSIINITAVSIAVLHTFHAYQHHNISIGKLLSVLNLSIQITDLMWWISELIREELNKLQQLELALQHIAPTTQVATPGCRKSATILPHIKKIIIANLSFAYNDQPQLIQHLNVQVTAGIPLIISGQSGTGKSTLGKLIAGEKPPEILYQGNIYWEQLNVKTLRHSPLNNLVMRIESNDALPNLPLQAYFYHPAIHPTLKQITWACDQVELATPSQSELNSQIPTKIFSTGQIQRLMLARALLLQPEILVLDEALCHLSNGLRSRLIRRLFGQRHSKITIIITHHPLNTRHNPPLQQLTLARK